MDWSAFAQTFTPIDLLRVALLALLEIALSADNALVVGLLARHLSAHQERKALLIGILSACVSRAILLAGASFLLRMAWLQFVGGLYLLYLAIHHLIPHKSPSFLTLRPRGSFWKTVWMIELFDLLFALDSVIAALGFIETVPLPQGAIHPKLWIVYIGVILGLIAVRFAARIFSRLIECFPRLERATYLIMGWIGLKLGAIPFFQGSFPAAWEKLFWGGLILLFLMGLTRKKR